MSTNLSSTSASGEKPTEKYLGPIELEKTNEPGEFTVWEIVHRGNKLIAGTACNVGLLESYAFEIDEGESVDEALQEFHADLQVECDDGAEYMSSRTTNANGTPIVKKKAETPLSDQLKSRLDAVMPPTPDAAPDIQ